MERFFTSQARTITGAAILLGAASFLSRLVGLARDRVFVHYFGAGNVLDSYYAAFIIPDFLFNLLLAGALTVGFVPIFLELWHAEKAKAWEMMNNLLSCLGVVMIVASGLAFWFAPALVQKIAPGFFGDKLIETILLTRIMLLSPILLGISGVLSSALHALRQFAAFAVAPLLYNLFIILSVVFFVPIFGVPALAWGVVMGAFFHLIIQLPSLWTNGFSFHWRFHWRDSSIKKVVSLVIPRTLGLAALQINFMILSSFASSMTAGSIAVFYLANNLYYVPIGLIGQSFSLAAFPIFANYIAEGKKEELTQHFSRVVRQIFFLIIPVMIVMVILRAQIVRVALGTGKFNWANTILTADTLAILGISLAAHCIMLITARALFALRDTWSTFITSAIGVLVTTIIAVFVKDDYGVRGLAFALSISIVIQSVILWLTLRHRIGNLGESKIILALAKISIASVFLAFVMQKLKAPIASIVDMTRLWGILSQGLICGMVGILVYGFICHILKLEEMELFKESFKRRWLKIWHISDSIDAGH